MLEELNVSNHPKTREYLSPEQWWILNNWLANHQEMLMTEKPRIILLAERLTKELGFKISNKHITRSKKITKVFWEPPISEKQNKGLQTLTRIDTIESQLQTIHTTVQRVEAEIAMMRGPLSKICQELAINYCGNPLNNASKVLVNNKK